MSSKKTGAAQSFVIGDRLTIFDAVFVEYSCLHTGRGPGARPADLE
ncbi:MAG TPA: hypothetical protein VFO10_15135 [Oligoflexus sp.]|nr:hypothetical protein [Oligoflexus sp.]HET9238593.1 hypothetical protein [Oligoflexus sp.]